MCGISGKITKHTHDGKSFAQKANSLLSHRGPDGQGFFSNGKLTFAHVRLSIIDISSAGAQPLAYENGQFQIVFNGEIYNYIEIKNELINLGFQFKTKTDTEVIVAAYKAWGEGFLSKLRGAFAFAVWDEKAQELLLARDRLGEKPLYYHVNEDGFIFSSELYALFKIIDRPLSLNNEAVDLFFHYGYLPDCCEWINDVKRVSSGSFIKVSNNAQIVKSCKFWDFNIDLSVMSNPKQIIKDQLDEISDIIVRSDVPVGVGLSAGVDSSAIAALAAKKIGNNLHAFSVGYPGRPNCDERSEAGDFARMLGIPFHEVELSTEAVVNSFPELVRSRNEPFVDLSGFGYLELFKAARSAGVPVMLLGQGGDELFWGYSFLSEAAYLTDRHMRCKKNGLSSIRKYLFSGDKIFFKRLLKEIKLFSHEWLTAFEHVHMMEITPDFSIMQSNRSNYFTKEFLENVSSTNSYMPMSAALDSGMTADQLIVKKICSTYLRENGMAQADRLGMSVGVEVRLPLCDFRLVELALGLKNENSDRHLPPKYWLREVMKCSIPEDIFTKPKRGFTPPMDKWVQGIFSHYGHWLDDGVLVREKILNPDTAKLWSKGQFEWRGVFPAPVKALSLEAWCRMLEE